MNDIKGDNATESSLFVNELLEEIDACFTATSRDQFKPIRPGENLLVKHMRY